MKIFISNDSKVPNIKVEFGGIPTFERLTSCDLIVSRKLFDFAQIAARKNVIFYFIYFNDYL